jgi:hypothetical protein
MTLWTVAGVGELAAWGIPYSSGGQLIAVSVHAHTYSLSPGQIFPSRVAQMQEPTRARRASQGSQTSLLALRGAFLASSSPFPS